MKRALRESGAGGVNKGPARGRCTQDGYVHLKKSEKPEHSKRAEARGAPRPKMRIDESERRVGEPSGRRLPERGGAVGSARLTIDPFSGSLGVTGEPRSCILRNDRERERTGGSTEGKKYSSRAALFVSQLGSFLASPRSGHPPWSLHCSKPSNVTATNPSRLQQR